MEKDGHLRRLKIDVKAIQQAKNDGALGCDTSSTLYAIHGAGKCLGDDIVLDKFKISPSSATPELAFDFAALGSSGVLNVGAAKMFAEKHGLLWHSWPKHRKGPLRENLNEWLSAAQQFAKIVRVYYLAQQLDRDDANKKTDLGTELRELLTERFDNEDLKNYLLPSASLFIQESFHEALKNAQVCVASRRFERQADDTFRETDKCLEFGFVIVPENLLQLAYISFAQIIVTHEPLAKCIGCTRFFAIEHGNRQYCTDTCRATYRKRRQRKAQKQKQLEVAGDKSGFQ